MRTDYFNDLLPDHCYPVTPPAGEGVTPKTASNGGCTPVTLVTPKTYRIAEEACRGLEITPDQFIALCSPDDLAAIEAGEYDAAFLRGHAESFAAGIQSGRIVFHPTSGELVRHGVCTHDQADRA